MATSMFKKLGVDRGREPVLVDYCRTPIGKRRGKLTRIRGDEMIIHVMKEIVKRNTALDPKLIEDSIIACNSQIGALALDIGKMAVNASGLPWTIPGTSVNRQCASGFQSSFFAWQQIISGDKDCVLAGGVEAQNTYAIGSDLFAVIKGKPVMFPPSRKVTENPYIRESVEKYRKYGIVSIDQITAAELMGHVWNEKVGNSYEEFRLELDELSLHSHQKAINTFDNRAKEIIPIRVPNVDEESGKPILDENGKIIEAQSEMAEKDEAPRPSTTVEKLQSLKGIVTHPGGYLTAGNSCPVSDGAGIAIWASRKFAEEHGLKIRATMEAMYTVGTDPVLTLTGPIQAVPPVLKRAGLTMDDMDFIEINEAFSTVVKACSFDLGLDWKDPRFNQWGGAIALGHPTAMTGNRFLGTLVHQLEESGKTYGLGSMCVGLGMGAAAVIKREGA